LFVGMFLSASFFFLALPFLLIGLLDSWIYLSAACLLDYNPTEVLVSYACPFDGVWKSAGEYLALTGSRLDGAEMLACGLATHFVPLEVFTHLRCLLEWNQIADFLHMACKCTW
jgi:enoyl-CoA hydratase/carnithine racemase